MNAAVDNQTLNAAEREAYRQRALQAGQDFLKRVDAILPIVRDGRFKSEEEGRVPQATVDAMIDAGVFRTFTPMAYGGLEVPPADFFDGIMRIAGADMSAAWCAGQINCHALEIAAMDPQMHQDFWGTFGPDARASSSYAPLGKTTPTEGGYILDGTWTFSSGVDFANYVLIGGGERNFMVPVKDLTIDHNSWDVSGLKGTGSKAITAKNLFVPNHRIHVLADVVNDINPGYAVANTPLFREVSWMTVFYSTATNAVIGAAREGVRQFMEQSRNRYTKMGTGAKLTENPFLHLKLIEALTKVNDTRNRQLNNWRHIFDAACKGEPIDHLERLRIRYESADSNGASFDALHELWPLVGATVSNRANPLQQIFRDLMSARTHGTAGRELAAAFYSRALLGMAPPDFKVVDFATAAYWK